jgi:putative ABC transport system permease protein
VLGFLVSLAFSLWPLGRTARIPATSLFRNHVITATGPAPWPYAMATLITLALLAAIIFFSFDNQRITGYFLLGLVLSFLGLLALALALTRLARLMPRPKNILWRQAISSLHRPGSSAVSVILALGLGLTLFVTLTLTDNTLTRELRDGLAQKAPAFFFLDVRNEDLEAFKTMVATNPGITKLANAPMLRGRFVTIKGQDVASMTPPPDIAWALRGDRGLTYAAQLPEGSSLTEGQWWPADYAGPNLVSMVDEIGKGLGLKIGDKITVNVLGRDVDAEIANFRVVNWRSLGINFVMVFSPGTLNKAPHSHIVTVDMTGGDEAKLLNQMARAYPSITAVRVKDVLTQISGLLAQMLTAIRAANSLTLLTGVLVLAGALAAGLSSRTYEAVVLKTYGASRRQLMLAFIIEYGVLGGVAAVFGILAGSFGSWFLARYVLEMPWSFSLSTALFTAVIAMVLTIATGLVMTNRALAAKPAPHLRNE